MTGLILKIEGIEEALSVELYIERDKSIKLEKGDLLKTFEDGKAVYYALVDVERIGRGHLMARVDFSKGMEAWAGGVRPIVVGGFTGYTIPCLGEGGSFSCGDYKVSFEKVDDVKDYIKVVDGVLILPNMYSVENGELQGPFELVSNEMFVV